MPCERVQLPGHATAAIVCTGRKPRRRCSCGSGQWTSLLCDHPAKKRSGTCDKPLCESCAVVVGEDRHHCSSHQVKIATAVETPRQGALDI